MEDHVTEPGRDAWNADLVALVADCHALWATVENLIAEPTVTLQRAEAHAARARARLDALQGHIDHAVRLAAEESGLTPRA